jgi:hypothetical protein
VIYGTRPARRSSRHGRVALSWVSALLLVSGVGADPDAVLSNEDIVRLLVAGTSVEQVIERIGASEVAFDLSAEMLDELSYAGVPPEVLRAMRERQAELQPVPATGSAAAEISEPARLIVTLAPLVTGKSDAPATIRVPEAVPPAIVEALGLNPSAPESLKVTDLALFVVCRTQDHVPDHWRNQSALGRDFVSMPRHKLLHFVPGVTPGDGSSGKNSRSAVLTLELPPRLEIEIEPGVLHDLSLGIAMQIDGRYYRMHSDDWEELELGSEDLAVHVQAGNGKGPGLGSIELRSSR